MAYKYRCTEFTLSRRRCKNKKRKCLPFEEYGKDLCHIHYMQKKSAALKIEEWYYNLKHKRSVLKIEKWYHKILFLKKKAAVTIQLAWLRYKDERCPICYENFTKDNIIKTNCGHRFCKDCLKSVFDTKMKDLDKMIYYDESHHLMYMLQLTRLNFGISDDLKCPICRSNVMKYDFIYTDSERALFNCIFVYKTDKYLSRRLTYLNQKNTYLVGDS